MRAARPFVVCAVVALLGAMLAVPSVGAAADVQINGDAPGTVQNEIRITRNPANPLNLAVAYNDTIYGPGSPLGSSFSVDGGLTWTDTQLGVPPHPVIGSPDDGIPLLNIFDPFIDSDPAGDVFAGYIATNWAPPSGFFTFPPNGLFIERSTDGGATWSGPDLIKFDPGSPVGNPAYRFNDRPDMEIDKAGNVNVVWINDVGANMPFLPFSDIWFTRSGPAGPPAPGNPTGLDFTGVTTG